MNDNKSIKTNGNTTSTTSTTKTKAKSKATDTTSFKEDCPVCIETYTAIIRRPVTCPKCQQSACIQCTKRYISESLNEPHCMHCQFGFTRTFLYNALNKTFMNQDYVKKRGEILWSREESYLHEAMPYIPVYKRLKELEDSETQAATPEMKSEQKDITKKIKALSLKSSLISNFLYTYISDYKHNKTYNDNNIGVYRKVASGEYIYLSSIPDNELYIAKYAFEVEKKDLEDMIKLYDTYKEKIINEIKETNEFATSKKELKDIKKKLDDESYSLRQKKRTNANTIRGDRNIYGHKYYAKKILEGAYDLNYKAYIYDSKSEEYKNAVAARGGSGGSSSRPEEKKEPERTFIRKCPANECKGFLSTAWKCEVCDNYTCNRCLVVVGSHDGKAKHECKKEDFETAELIKSTSKPCPNCGEFIQKSYGCQQMFCTMCHTGFDWNTLKIVKNERIHNPHYFDWLNKNKGSGGGLREIGDIPCGGIPEMAYNRKLIGDMQNRRGFTDEDITKYNEITQGIVTCALDVFGRIIPQYRTDVQYNNTMHRVKYMSKDLTKEKYMSVLQHREKEREFNYEVRCVLDTFIAVIIEYLTVYANAIRNYVGDTEVFKVVNNDQYKNCIEFREFINKQLTEIGLFYNMSVPLMIDHKMETTGSYIGYNRWYIKDTKIPNPNARGKRVKKEVKEDKSETSSISTARKAADAFDSDSDNEDENVFVNNVN